MLRRVTKPNARRKSAKQEMRDALDRLPNNCSIEDMQYRLYVMETIKRRIETIDNGKLISQAQVEQRVRKWLVK